MSGGDMQKACAKFDPDCQGIFNSILHGGAEALHKSMIIIFNYH